MNVFPAKKGNLSSKGVFSLLLNLIRCINCSAVTCQMKLFAYLDFCTGPFFFLFFSFFFFLNIKQGT